MGGLHHQLLHAARNCPLHGLLHIVDELAVTRLHMVDDDLGGKGPAYGPVGERCLDGILDALDILHTAAVEGSTEAHHQDFLLADVIGVPGIVQTGIAGVTAKVIRVFHQFLLGIGQSIPGCLGFSALGIRVLGALLDVDCVDQFRHGIGGCLVLRLISHRRTAGAKQHRCRQHTGNQGSSCFLVHDFFLLVSFAQKIFMNRTRFKASSVRHTKRAYKAQVYKKTFREEGLVVLPNPTA